MIVIFGAIALLGGVFNTIASGSNAALSKGLGQPVIAALTITSINALLYVATIPFVGFGIPNLSEVADVPWWAWLGGLLGGFYVLASIFFAEKLGAAVFIGLSVSAGLVTSVVLDHFGLVGFKQHSAGIWRILGCLCMIGGLTLVSVF